MKAVFIENPGEAVIRDIPRPVKAALRGDLRKRSGLVPGDVCIFFLSQNAGT